jgi:hypothetical protein
MRRGMEDTLLILRRALILIGIVGLLGVILSGYASLVASRADKPWMIDFSLFYISAQSLRSGGDVYRVVPIDHLGPLPESIQSSHNHLPPNLNMPVVALLFWPFSLGSLAAGMTAWSIFAIGFVLVSAALFGNQLAASRDLPAFHRWMLSGVVAILMLAYFPTWASAALGQLGQLLLLVLCGAWLAARKERDRLAGALFGIALVMKPFTGVFLLLFPWLGRWRLLRWYAGTFAALSLLGAVVAGPSSYLRYLSALQEVNWYASGWNASLMAPLSVLLGGGEAPGWLDYPHLAKPISIVCAVLLYAMLVARVRRIDDPATGLNIAVAGAIPLMLLASPLGWLYYFSLMWIAAAALVEAVWPLPSRWIWWLSSTAVLILCGLPYPFLIGRKAGASLESLLLTSADTVALLLAFAFVLAAARRVSAPPQAAPAAA